MRKRPSATMVVALVALFFSLSGTALAAVIVTSNSQVAAHVIAGANAPTGDNSNLIPGSVGTSDLHAAAVTSGKLAPNSVGSASVVDGSLTGADIKESSLGQVPSAANGGTKVDFASSAAGNQFIPIVKVDRLTIGALCVAFQGITTVLRVQSSTTGLVDYTFTTGLNGAYGGTFMNGVALSPGIEGTIGQASAQSGNNVDRTEGQFVYRDAHNVISLVFDVVADGNTNTCEISGTAFGTS